MKIGLIRHFRVLHPYPQKKLVETKELLQWFKDYDEAEIEISEVDLLGVDWKYCYSSDLHRSLQTAEYIFPGEVVKRTELREVPITPFKKRLKLPFLVWAMLVRLSWMTNKEKKNEIMKIREGINKLLDEALAQKGETLIVSHGALMIFMAKELKKRGFHGPKLGNPQNGKVYIFHNEE
ncbi:MAG TPA: histidine phosphatase family protein [Pseudoneobacillus sp.]|nr:histidine phosphatase family protein [Pseudoneobacillus sp.]